MTLPTLDINLYAQLATAENPCMPMIIGTWWEYYMNLSPTKPLPISPAMRSKCWNTGGVGVRS